MTSEELQKTINENLRLTGKESRFKITVAKEGMIWIEKKLKLRERNGRNKNNNWVRYLVLAM